jgi:octaprenyl-diphosphate synthase
MRAGKVITRDEYFRAMEETWKVVHGYMLERISRVGEENQEAGAVLRGNYVVRKRMFGGSPKMRPMLLRMCFEACRGGDWKGIVPACAAVELLNISTYVINAVFDEKGEQQYRKDPREYTIVGMILRDLAAECINEVGVSLSSQGTRELNDMMSEISLLAYIGQQIDLYQLKKGRRGAFRDTEEMKRLYFRRAELFCGHFMRNVARMGALLADATAVQRNALDRYGLALGRSIQVINDMGDFVTEEAAIDYEKTYKDQFSDIRQGKLTLPVIRALELDGRLVRSVLGKRKALKSELRAVARYMKASGIVSDVKAVTKQDYRTCRKELRKLPESEARDMLSVMASMLRTNKYYSFFRELR